MAPENVIRFSQKNLPYTSFTAFEEMRVRGVLCDLTVKVENQSFKAHRVILAGGIPYFQSLYMNGGAKAAVEEIPLEGLDPTALESLIQFAYTNILDISFENVYSLIHASDFLRLKQVFDACVQFLLDRLDNGNVVPIHELAHRFKIRTLTERTDEYMRENFEKIFRRDDFLGLPHSCIQKVASDDNLNVSNEETVFEAVVKWAAVSPSERLSVLPELLREVRMVFLSPDYLVNKVTSNDLVKKSRPCMDHLEDVKNYHLLPRDRASFSQLKTQPRKFYCSDGGIYAIWYSKDTGYSVHHCDLERARISHNLGSLEGPHGDVYGVTAVNEKIYVFQEKTIHTFHVKTRRWETLEPTHNYMKGAAIASHRNLIYFFGSELSTFSDKIRCFDTVNNRWIKTENMNAGRFNSAATSLGEYVYITGGFWSNFMSFIYLLGFTGGNDVEKYSPARKRCSKVAPMLTPRESHFCTSLNGNIYVCGGVNSSGLVHNVETYDPLTDKWSFVSSMPSTRSPFLMVLHSGKIYALHGERGNVCFEIYDPQSDTWNTGHPLHNEGCLECRLRFAASCVRIADSPGPSGS